MQRVVYHSVMHPYSPGVPHHIRKASAEASLRASALTWTIIQPNTYAQNVLSRLRRTADGAMDLLSLWPVSVPAQAAVDPCDVAEAEADVLDDDVHAFATYELAGPELLTAADVAERIGRAWDIRVTARQVGPDDLPARSADLSHLADHYAYHAHYAEHGFPGSSVVLSVLLGRRPTPLEDVIRRYVPDHEVR